MATKRKTPGNTPHSQFTPQLREIRNFSIIAHIDHGKTTLTDRLLKYTGTISEHEEGERILDSNPIEKERGITIKLAPVTMDGKRQGEHGTLNLIDTPGHVDFSYEVSRSLAACEGAVLLVDATQGIQAQTLSHAQKAIDLGLTLIPAVNKIDLESARIEESLSQLEEIFGFKENEISRISAKTGEGVGEILDRIEKEIPPPGGKPNEALRALIFNSLYDVHFGVIAFIKVVDGALLEKQKLRLLAGRRDIDGREIGIFTPDRIPVKQLPTGTVGYIATGLKDIRALKVGDTITDIQSSSQTSPLPGFREPKPVVFADIYPTQEGSFDELKSALEKLKLTDAALAVKQSHAPALGAGFRLGFLGVFHSKITQERLRREQGVNSILTKPTVEYLVQTKEKKKTSIYHASELPDPAKIAAIFEPTVEATVLAPRGYLGELMKLFQERRGTHQNTYYFGDMIQMIYRLPLVELISGFVDQLKSASQGFASLDYRHIEPQPVDAVKLTILVNHQEVKPLARICVRSQAQKEAKETVKKMKDILPRQLFAVPIQAAIGGKVIARETKPAARKDVTAKLYGGDRTRRMKLLAKQKKGKKKLAQFGQVGIPPEAFEKLMGV